METSPIDNIHFQGVEALDQDQDLEQWVHVKNPPKDHGLHQSFSQDQLELDQPSQQISSFPKEEEVLARSFLSRWIPWWGTEIKKPADAPATSAQANASAVVPHQPIDVVPALEAPKLATGDLPLVELPPLSPTVKTRESVGKLSEDQLQEAITRMSQYSIEQVMKIVLIAQMELEKENANVAETTYNKFQHLKELQQKTSQAIQEVLEKDERIAGYLKTAQNIALFASTICTLASIAVTAGVTTPAVVLLGSVGVGIVTGITTALTTGSNAYFEGRANEDQAKLTGSNHSRRHYGDKIVDMQEHLSNIAEADNRYKGILIRMLKEFSKMRSLMAQK